MRLTLLILGIIFIGLNSIGQVEWIKVGGSIGQDWCADQTTDDKENVITLGGFVGMLDVQDTTLVGQSDRDIFLLKTDVNGNPVWSKSFGQAGTIYPRSVKVVNEFIYVLGDYVGTIDFDTIVIQSTSSKDIFIAKFNSDGTPLFAKSFGGYDIDQGSKISADSSGNIFIAGSCRVSVDIDPTSGVDLSGTGGMFLIKMNENDEYQWSKVFEAHPISSILDICFDENQNIVLVGRFMDPFDSDPGINENMLSSDSDDGFIIKLNSVGDFLWSKSIGAIFSGSGNVSTDYATAVVCDSENNIIWGGVYTGELQIPELSTTAPQYGYSDIFIQKLNENGNLIWSEAFGDSEMDGLSDINVDVYDNILVCGAFNNTIDFDPGPNQAMHYSPDGGNFYCVSFTTDGSYLHSFNFSGVCSSSANRMSISSSGVVYFSGSFDGSLIVNAPPVNETFNSVMYSDLFFGKLTEYENSVFTVNEDVKFSLYPNPSEGIYQIRCMTQSGNIPYTITDIHGNIILNGIMENEIEVIDLSDFSNGLYIFNTSTESSKIIKW